MIVITVLEGNHGAPRRDIDNRKASSLPRRMIMQMRPLIESRREGSFSAASVFSMPCYDSRKRSSLRYRAARTSSCATGSVGHEAASEQSLPSLSHDVRP